MTSKMRKEALEASLVVANQFALNQKIIGSIADDLIAKDPYSVVSIARGSSDHACQYMNYLFMSELGLLPTSLSMSILTMYQAKLKTAHSIGLAISQSGQSPDVVNPLKYFSENALSTVALVNDTESPLAKVAKHTIPLHAKKEESVAATKSFIASLSASAHLVASMSKNQRLLTGLQELPEVLTKAQNQSWSEAIEILKNAKRIMTIGRGFGFSLALESALKFKEVCSIQAEAFSAAEVKHGPQALIEEGYPLLVYATHGPTMQSMLDLAQDMKQRGANVILAAPSDVKERMLTIEASRCEELDIISGAQSFYLMIEELAQSLGRNPDAPKHLSKVTKTH